MQEGRREAMDIYLLDVGELIQDRVEAQSASMLRKVDETRRERVIAAKTPQGRAAQLGAGLLLQRAVRDWQEKSGADALEDKPGQEPRIQRLEVRSLISEVRFPLALTYRYGSQGKPYFKEFPLFFSLSHSGEYVLCAVSRREVGADIQRLTSVNELKLANRFFSEPESRVLERCESASERRRLFFGFWTRKEAWGKLTGEGVAAVLRKDMQGADAGQDMEWTDFVPPEGYAAAVCQFRRDSLP